MKFVMRGQQLCGLAAAAGLVIGASWFTAALALPAAPRDMVARNPLTAPLLMALGIALAATGLAIAAFIMAIRAGRRRARATDQQLGAFGNALAQAAKELTALAATQSVSAAEAQSFLAQALATRSDDAAQGRSMASAAEASLDRAVQRAEITMAAASDSLSQAQDHMAPLAQLARDLPQAVMAAVAGAISSTAEAADARLDAAAAQFASALATLPDGPSIENSVAAAIAALERAAATVAPAQTGPAIDGDVIETLLRRLETAAQNLAEMAVRTPDGAILRRSTEAAVAALDRAESAAATWPAVAGAMAQGAAILQQGAAQAEQVFARADKHCAQLEHSSALATETMENFAGLTAALSALTQPPPCAPDIADVAVPERLDLAPLQAQIAGLCREIAGLTGAFEADRTAFAATQCAVHETAALMQVVAVQVETNIAKATHDANAAENIAAVVSELQAGISGVACASDARLAAICRLAEDHFVSQRAAGQRLDECLSNTAANMAITANSSADNMQAACLAIDSAVNRLAVSMDDIRQSALLVTATLETAQDRAVPMAPLHEVQALKPMHEVQALTSLHEVQALTPLHEVQALTNEMAMSARMLLDTGLELRANVQETLSATRLGGQSMEAAIDKLSGLTAEVAHLLRTTEDTLGQFAANKSVNDDVGHENAAALAHHVRQLGDIALSLAARDLSLIPHTLPPAVVNAVAILESTAKNIMTVISTQDRVGAQVERAIADVEAALHAARSSNGKESADTATLVAEIGAGAEGLLARAESLATRACGGLPPLKPSEAAQAPQLLHDIDTAIQQLKGSATALALAADFKIESQAA